MNRLYALFLACFLVLANLAAQSHAAEYEAALLRALQSGAAPLTCGHSHPSFQSQHNEFSRACPGLTTGYGTNGWQPGSNNGHPLGNAYDINCVVPNVPVPACLSGVYWVPLTITVFENPAHTGSNYLGGTGFATLTDVDINTALTTLNNYYLNSRIQFYEARPRRRIVEADIYDFYTTSLGSNDPGTGVNDGLDDLTESASYDVSNMINLYFVGGLNGNHGPSGVTGFAPYPSSRDYSVMAYRALFGSTLYHELGHYFGLAHTHNNAATNNDNPQYPPHGAMNNSDCLTTGDRICDTWPDPNFTGCNSPSCAYNTTPSPPCGVLTIPVTSGTNYGGGVSTILQRNIMNYNSFSGCRRDFSPCQYRKIHDILLACRNNLCDPEVSRHFNSMVVNHAESPYKSICLGDAIPTFTAKSGNCYNWYAQPTGGTALAVASNTFTPTAAQLNVNAVGTTYFYIQEVNAFNADCRQRIEVVVNARPGSGRQQGTGVNSISINTSGAACVETSGMQLGSDQVLGWWLTVDQPISTSVTNNTQLQTQLSSASVNALVSTASPNHVFEASSNGHQHCVNLDCAVLDPSKDYYLTPFVSSKRSAIADAVCSAAGNDVRIQVNIPTGVEGGRAILPAGSWACARATPPNPTFTVTLQVTSYTGTANNLQVRLRNNTTNATLIAEVKPGVGTYTYTQADFPAGFDPNVQGINALLFDPGTAFGAGDIMTFRLIVDVTYPGRAAINFPTASYHNCLFGSAVRVNCQVNTAVATSAGCVSGTVNGVSGSTWFPVLDGSGRLIAAVNPQNNNLGNLRVDLNDMPSVPMDPSGNPYLPRYWNFESSNFAGRAQLFPNGPVRLRLYLLDAELAAYNTAASLSVAANQLNLTHYAGDNEDCLMSNNNYATASLSQIPNSSISTSAYNSASGAGYQLEFELPHFSELGASGLNVLLSLQWLEAKAVLENGRVLVSWKVQQDAQAHRFILQRSSDGLHFEEVAEQSSLGQAGQIAYQQVDEHPLPSQSYYRILWRSTGAVEQYSRILPIELPQNQDFRLIPNPVKGHEATLVVQLEEAQEAWVEWWDVHGRLVAKQPLSLAKGINYVPVSLEGLAAGVYGLRLQQGSWSRSTTVVKH